MRGVLWALVIVIAWCNLVCYVTAVPFITPGKKQSSKKPFSLDDYLNSTITFRGFSGTWISDNEILLQKQGNLVIQNIETDQENTFLSSDVLAKWNGSYPTISPNRKKVLFRYDMHSVFRHSTTARCDVYDLETNETTKLQSNERLQLCVWSPSGNEVAYVYKNNVYYWDGTKTHQFTVMGVEGVEYYGIADWVYEEEVLSESAALWFSPDAKKLAIAEFNDTLVTTFNLPFYSNPASRNEIFQYPEELHLKYPKPGTSNPGVFLKVRSLANDQTSWILLPAPINVVTYDHILQSVTWIDNDNVLAIWLNRRQNVASLQKCSSEGVCTQVTRFDEPDGWITVSKPKCYSSRNTCIFTYWIEDWLQIWELDLETGQNKRNALGNFTVISIYGFKESTGDIFYLGTGRNHPEQRHVYRNSECLSCKVTDESGAPCTYASATFSKNFSFYALTCSGPNPTYASVYRSSNQQLMKHWEQNKASLEKLEAYALPNVQYLQVSVGNGSMAMVKLSLPPELNPDSYDPSKKYPMIVYVYGGPNSVRVTDAFSIGFDKYLTTSRKIIYAQIDGRGSGYKGKKMLFEINNRMGTVEIEDQIGVVKSLVSLYKFIDTERIGIWGWSYGGYATAMVLSRDVDHVFQCGISVAPVTSWIYYDTIYTERYMGLPTAQGNLKQYLASDVTKGIDQFKSHDFMLIHGTGDDNVHYQQALALAKALQQAGILFEQVSYPDEDHSLGNVQRHLYHTMDQFWANCLNLEEEE